MKFVILILLLLQCSLVFPKKIEKKQHPLRGRKVAIVGGGPVGLYAALKLLLEDPTVKVDLYSAREKDLRKQTVRIPFENAKFLKGLPSSRTINLGNKMWDPSRQSDYFDPKTHTENKKLTLWPELVNYDYLPLLTIGTFCNVLKDYLLERFGPGSTDKRFAYKYNANQKRLSENVVWNWNKPDTDVIFIAAGNSPVAVNLRTKMNINVQTNEKINPLNETRGLYLIYNNPNIEDFKTKKITIFGVADKGLTYAASNNEGKEVQLYTFPYGELLEVYNSKNPPFPSIERMQKLAGFPNYLEYNNNFQRGCLITSKETLAVNPQELAWLKHFKKKLDHMTAGLGITIPPTNVKLFWAQRYEYHYAKNTGVNKNNIPIFFIGDSAGATDYKLGLNLGRGMFGVDFIVETLRNNDLNNCQNEYDTYWKSFLVGEKKEFGNKYPTLAESKWLIFRYIIVGKDINGKLYENTQNDFNAWKRLPGNTQIPMKRKNLNKF